MDPETRADWIAELRRSNDLMEKLVRNQRDWRLSLRHGLLVGLGSAIGATLLVSMVVWVLQPLGHLESFRPILEEISSKLEGPRGR